MRGFSPQLFFLQYWGTLVIVQELLAYPWLTLSWNAVSITAVCLPGSACHCTSQGTQQSRQLFFILSLPCHVPAVLRQQQCEPLERQAVLLSGGMAFDRRGWAGRGLLRSGWWAGANLGVSEPTLGTFPSSVIPGSQLRCWMGGEAQAPAGGSADPCEEWFVLSWQHQALLSDQVALASQTGVLL